MWYLPSSHCIDLVVRGGGGRGRLTDLSTGPATSIQPPPRKECPTKICNAVHEQGGNSIADHATFRARYFSDIVGMARETRGFSPSKSACITLTLQPHWPVAASLLLPSPTGERNSNRQRRRPRAASRAGSPLRYRSREASL